MQQLTFVTNYGRFSKAKGIELFVFFEMCNTISAKVLVQYTKS